jgi:hypothetical protein
MAVGLRGTRVNGERRGIERASEREREKEMLEQRHFLPFLHRVCSSVEMHLCACVFAEVTRACVRDMNVAQGVMSLCLMQERGVPMARPRPNHRGCKRQHGRGRALARAIECSMGSARLSDTQGATQLLATTQCMNARGVNEPTDSPITKRCISARTPEHNTEPPTGSGSRHHAHVGRSFLFLSKQFCVPHTKIESIEHTKSDDLPLCWLWGGGRGPARGALLVKESAYCWFQKGDAQWHARRPTSSL